MRTRPRTKTDVSNVERTRPARLIAPVRFRTVSDDSSIMLALAMTASARCVRTVDPDVDPRVHGGQNDHCGCKHTEKNEEPHDRNKPMKHRLFEMGDVDGHPVTVICDIVQSFRHGCSRIGADGR
jgi:hypothetical protein